MQHIVAHSLTTAEFALLPLSDGSQQQQQQQTHDASRCRDTADTSSLWHAGHSDVISDRAR